MIVDVDKTKNHLFDIKGIFNFVLKIMIFVKRKIKKAAKKAFKIPVKIYKIIYGLNIDI